MHSSLNKALSGGSGIPFIDNSARTLKKASGDYGLSPNAKLIESNKKQKKVGTIFNQVITLAPGNKNYELVLKSPSNKPRPLLIIIVN